ncbi:glycosyltransferase [Clostridium perfringens]|uniref:Glycosyltransferase n=1 Tax=Clostridium perfringens TaxID=1502 RepID=A0AAW9ICP7_CLOPF|nr:glycosyltransferase [Clostridium perfringens]MDH5092757.1 putative glycosyltransferase EpsJ [Clostridium perfringens]MDZ4998784.1 glycosyltransferase [Clostridium perfringens]
MENIKISFIVPVYNVERYLSKCLDSLVNQTINEKEVIIINDGSTDNSLEICNMYKDKYDFIKIINQKNGGLSSARNNGIKNSKGKYIQFVDSDDYIDVNCGKIFVDLCEKNNLDIIRGKYHTYNEEEGIIKQAINLKDFKYLNKVVNSREYFLECIECEIYEVTACIGLIKREFLLKNKVFFVEGIAMEDHEFTMKCLTINENAKVMQIDYDFYTYVRHGGSITTTPTTNKIIDIINNCNSMKLYASTLNLDQDLTKALNKAVSSLFYQATSIYGRIDKNDRKKVKSIMKDDILDFSIENSFSYYQKRKFLIFKYFNVLFDLIYDLRLKNMK